MPYNADSTAIEDIIKMLPPAAQAEARAAYRSKGVSRVPGVTSAAPSATIAAPTGNTAVDETEDDTQDQTGGLGGVQAAAAPTAPNPLMDFLNTAKADLAEQEETRAQQFKDAKARIEQMYAQPSREDLLIALSRGFLSPKPYRGFAGTMHNLSEALGGFNEASKAAQLQRQQALMQLQQSYDTGTLANKKELLALGLKGATAQAAAMRPRNAISKVYTDNLGVTRHKTYGTEIKQPPMADIANLQKYLADPRNSAADKATTIRNFDSAYGYGASDIFGGQ